MTRVSVKWRPAVGSFDSVDASRIVVRVNPTEVDQDASPVDIYNLTKYKRSNQNTCVNQRPIVSPGDTVPAWRYSRGRTVG